MQVGGAQSTFMGMKSKSFSLPCEDAQDKDKDE